MLVIALGAIVFPVKYLLFLFSRQRWSLKTFSLLPLIFILPFFALQLSIPGKDFSALLSFPVIGKLLYGALMLPAIIFIATSVGHFRHGRWKYLAYFGLLTVILSFCFGLWMLSSQPLVANSRYDFTDVRLLWLLLVGAWLIGLGIIAIWIFVRVGRLVIRSAKRIFSRPKMATS